ncbi:hypothetical protein MAE02_47420 [Microvirga aerophila]|uniref:Uncharacterized protein n=1 Tax=Microvirga aerophila TaxID=670291 RepID=A0A512BYK9_9HYPH|nr:hypothetical protein MAE02_47420 [Microvirga aerophila]
MGAKSLPAQAAHHDIGSGLAKTGMADARDAGIRVFHGRYNPRDPGFNNRIRARGRPAMMRARLQGHIESCASGSFAGRREGHPLRMRPAPYLGGTLRDDDRLAVGKANNNGAYRRVGPGEAEVPLAKGKRQAHVTFVLKGLFRRQFSYRGDHQSDCTGLRFFSRGESSDSSSASLPRISSKSLASRKFL